jgi:hypothetical protein
MKNSNWKIFEVIISTILVVFCIWDKNWLAFGGWLCVILGDLNSLARTYIENIKKEGKL